MTSANMKSLCLHMCYKGVEKWSCVERMSRGSFSRKSSETPRCISKFCDKNEPRLILLEELPIATLHFYVWPKEYDRHQHKEAKPDNRKAKPRAGAAPFLGPVRTVPGKMLVVWSVGCI